MPKKNSNRREIERQLAAYGISNPLDGNLFCVVQK